MNKLSLQILNHEFFEELLGDLKTYLKESLGDKVYTPSEFEQYSLSVFKRAMRIEDCFKTLEHAKAYLSHFRTNKRYKEAGIMQVNHINYHYFHYAITVVTIMDVALILTNDTFRLGNPEKLCYFENIVKNSWLRSSNVDKLLNNLRSIVEPWREPRNIFVHRGEKLDRELLTALEGYDILHEKKDKLVTMISSSDVKRLYKFELSKIYKEFEQTENPLFNAISELLSQLIPIYSFWRNKLKQTSNG